MEQEPPKKYSLKNELHFDCLIGVTRLPSISNTVQQHSCDIDDRDEDNDSILVGQLYSNIASPKDNCGTEKGDCGSTSSGSDYDSTEYHTRNGFSKTSQHYWGDHRDHKSDSTLLEGFNLFDNISNYKNEEVSDIDEDEDYDDDNDSMLTLGNYQNECYELVDSLREQHQCRQEDSEENCYFLQFRNNIRNNIRNLVKDAFRNKTSTEDPKKEKRRIEKESIRRIVETDDLWEELRSKMKSCNAITNACAKDTVHTFIANRNERFHDLCTSDLLSFQRKIYNGDSKTIETRKKSGSLGSDNYTSRKPGSSNETIIIGRRNSMHGVKGGQENCDESDLDMSKFHGSHSSITTCTVDDDDLFVPFPTTPRRHEKPRRDYALSA